jgi:branched-chain amino acid transport system permease protein
VGCGDACGPILAQLLVYGLTNGAVVALNALGFTLAYAVARQLNLAHGNAFALTTVAVASLARAAGVTAADPMWVRIGLVLGLIVLAAGMGALLAGAVERLAFRPFKRGADPLGPLIASVGLAFVMLQAAIWWHAATTTPQPGHQGVALPLLAMPDLLPVARLDLGGVIVTLKDGLVLLLAGAASVGAWLLLARTRLGRQLRASAEDPETAALCGADPVRAQALAFVLGGALAGVGAAIFALYYGGTTAQHGLRGTLAPMTAAVLGGIGKPVGALVGGVAIGVFSAYSDFFLSAHWTPLLVLAALVLLLACRPSGLLERGGAGSSEDVPRTPASHYGARRLPAATALALGLAVAALLFPLLDSLAGWQRLPSAITALLLVALAVGLNLVVGLAGLLDLGYAAFFAIGGYTAAILTASGSRVGVMLPDVLREPWLALAAAGGVAAVFGLLFGLPSIRTRGQYLAIVTLALGEIVPGLIVQLPRWTNGPRGMTGIPAPWVGPWGPGSPLHAYGLALLLALGAILAASRLQRARAGRAWAAVRDDEVAALAVGVSPSRAKLLAFALGAAVAGLAGTIFAGLHGHIEPEQFDVTLSLMVLAAVVIGGRWGLGGVVLAAMIVALYDRVLVDMLTAVVRGLGGVAGVEWLRRADLRDDNFAVFGLALYLATVLRTRGG